MIHWVSTRRRTTLEKKKKKETKPRVRSAPDGSDNNTFTAMNKMEHKTVIFSFLWNFFYTQPKNLH